MKPSPHLAASIPPVVFARLTAAIGIDPRTLDAGRLKWILSARCRHLLLADAPAYAAYLEQNPAELDALIDQVVVQETRFFRDPAVFDHIRTAIAQIAATVTGPLRILSAPCGTGQEPYSLAAMLTLAGVPPAQVSIDAFDISLSALAVARRGVYPEHALTHVSPELQHACGLRRQRHWEVHEALRERVRFDRRNLAEPSALGAEAQYHLILCRNLFIYLRPEARTALAESLAAALVPGGRLILGTADRTEELNLLFAPLRPAASFAFVHRPPAEAAPLRAPSIAVPPRWVGSRPVKSVAAQPPPIPKAVPDTATTFYKRALEHQQQGDLARAERRCRQALYLAPSYLPALELLQSLWSQNPNLRLRRALRDRILRNQRAAPEGRPAWKETA
jgi:chemotaxis protein methyltransferase WspC